MGGPTAWVAGTTGKDACWDEDYGDSGGWVEGKNSAPSDLQKDVRLWAEGNSEAEGMLLGVFDSMDEWARGEGSCK